MKKYSILNFWSFNKFKIRLLLFFAVDQKESPYKSESWKNKNYKNGFVRVRSVCVFAVITPNYTHHAFSLLYLKSPFLQQFHGCSHVFAHFITSTTLKFSRKSLWTPVIIVKGECISSNAGVYATCVTSVHVSCLTREAQHTIL